MDFSKFPASFGRLLYNDLVTESIGELMRQRRESQRISLEQAAQAIHIRLRYLEALENDALEVLPSKAQARGFLRAYAQYLKMAPEPLLEILDGEEPAPASSTLLTPGVQAPSREPGSAEAIFASVGQNLRRQREMLGFSQDDIERQTHLRRHYLQALEDGRIADLPSSVQGRGMLSNYAEFLGLDVDAILLRYADGLQQQLLAKRGGAAARKPVAAPVSHRLRSLQASRLLKIFSPDLLIGGLLVIFIGAFLVWSLQHLSDAQASQEPTPTAASIADILAPPTATPSPATPANIPTTALDGGNGQVQETLLAETPTPSGQELPTNTPQPSPTLPALSSSSIVQVYIAVRQRAWMRVSVDGELAFEGRVLPGSTYLYEGIQRVEVLTGNGAALQIFFNRVDLGPMGILGQVVERIFTLGGMQTPTPAVTFTAQPTPTATITPSETPTGVPGSSP